MARNELHSCEIEDSIQYRTNIVQAAIFLVTLAERPHPFPSRTRKLSSPAPKILRGQPFGNIGRRQDFCVFKGCSVPNRPPAARRPCAPPGQPLRTNVATRRTAPNQDRNRAFATPSGPTSCVAEPGGSTRAPARSANLPVARLRATTVPSPDPNPGPATPARPRGRPMTRLSFAR
jgi:hypothetical protein